MAALLGWSAAAQTNFRPLSLDQAVEQAKKENKLVFVDFYTDWCGPCRVMSRDVFPQKNVGDYFNARFVSIKLNAEKEGKADAATYDVKAYPTFLVLDTDKRVQLDIKGSMSAEVFLSKIEAGLNPRLSPEKMKERYDGGERTPELVNAYAFHFMQQGREDEGYRIVNDYFRSLTDARKMAPENYFLFSRYTLDLDDVKAGFLSRHCREFAPSVREQAQAHVQKLYRSALIQYLSGYMFEEGRFDEAAYTGLKQEICSLGLDKSYPYAPVFALVECYARGDKAAYVELLGKERQNMAPGDFELVLLNTTRLLPVATTDKALLADMAGLIRSQLADMKPSIITVMGRLLNELEQE